MDNPRVVKAFAVTRALGLHDEEVKPVLKNLLQVYEKNWELIEEDNYRTLLDAFFELKEKEVNLLTHSFQFRCFMLCFPGHLLLSARYFTLFRF